MLNAVRPRMVNARDRNGQQVNQRIHVQSMKKCLQDAVTVPSCCGGIQMERMGYLRLRKIWTLFIFQVRLFHYGCINYYNFKVVAGLDIVVKLELGTVIKLEAANLIGIHQIIAFLFTYNFSIY